MYYCQSCGTLRVDDEACYVCGSENVNEYEDDAGGEYVCEECGEGFDSEAAYRGHQNAHRED